MKAIIQKVLKSAVTVDQQVVGSIGKGYNVLLGIGADDTTMDAEWIIGKLLRIRLWNKQDAASSLSSEVSQRWSDDIQQAGGGILLISQFTLFSQLKGNKVDFHRAMKGPEAKVLYDYVFDHLARALPQGQMQAGVFGAMMQVEIVNDGPVTVEIDSRNK